MTRTDRRNGLIGELGVKPPVRCATTANITLSGFQTIDGITLADGDANLRVLVKNQNTTTENGIYIASSSAWQRATDFDGNLDVVDGTRVWVNQGITNGDKEWQVSVTDPVVIGTSAIAFTRAGFGLLAVNNLNDLENAATARANLGVAIGSDVQAYNANLAALSGLTGSSGKMSYFTGAGAMALKDLFSNRNAIINGNFDIWQRGLSFTSVADVTYTADRWLYQKSGAMVHDITRSSDVPTAAQAGRLFNYSILVDCQTVDSSIAAGDYAWITQKIEGYTWRNLAQKAITLSFWVKATKIGTYCIALTNGGADRSYIAEYTINQTNTWELKTFNITASPSAGTWDYSSGVGLRIIWTLATGSTRQTAAGSWAVGDFVGSSNQVNACDSTSNNFYICGIQLEVGNVVTPFEELPIATQLALCERYYENSYNLETTPGTASTGAGQTIYTNQNTQTDAHTSRFKTQKRSAPSITSYSPVTGATGKIHVAATPGDINISISDIGEYSFVVRPSSSTVLSDLYYHWAADAEL